MSHKSPADFIVQAQELDIDRWDVHDCSICGYTCGYVFRDGKVFYDSGCYCTGRRTLELRSWEDVAEHYNMQTNEDVIARMNSFWNFNAKADA